MQGVVILYVLKQELFIKSDGLVVQYSVNAVVEYGQKIWGGLSYRGSDAFSIMVGYKFGKGEFGYCYDIPASNFASTAGGTHEFMISYCFSVSKAPIRGKRVGVRNLDRN